MQRRTLLLSAAALGAGAADAEPASALQVVASFSILADMVREVGGPAVSVKSLVPTDGDAHTYQPRPSDLRSLQAAGLVVMNGLGMEGWMDRLLPSAGITGPVVIASAGVTARRMGEGTDPHAWQDPANGVLYANNIAAGLAKADPAKAAAIWVKAENSKLSPADAEKIVRDPQNEWTTTPKKVLTYLDYMNRAGLVAAKAADQGELFFPGAVAKAER